MKMIRPKCQGSTITTPGANFSIELLGAHTYKNLALTTDQLRAIQKLYGFVEEKPNKRPEPPEPPIRSDFNMEYEYENAVHAFDRMKTVFDNWEGPIKLMQAGANHNAIRHAESDGLRVIAWLAKFVPAGEDPLKHVIQMAAEGGLDVDFEDLAWAGSIDDVELDKK